MPSVAKSVLAALTAAAVVAPAAVAAPLPVREFAGIVDADQVRFDYALRYGSDLVKRNPGGAFTLFLDGRGVLLVIPGMTVAQRNYRGHMSGTNGRLRIVACRETVNKIQKQVRRSLPVRPGVRVESCDGAARKLLAAGWQRMLGGL